jgi:diadenosine tetraphosphate (Ap4A) HIT family hydrolase
VINKVIRTKEHLHLHTLPRSRTTNNVHPNRINHRAQTYIKQIKKHTKNKAPIKKKTLKERTKEQARLDGSLKNTKCALKGKAWLILKR